MFALFYYSVLTLRYKTEETLITASWGPMDVDSDEDKEGGTFLVSMRYDAYSSPFVWRLSIIGTDGCLRQRRGRWRGRDGMYWFRFLSVTYYVLLQEDIIIYASHETTNASFTNAYPLQHDYLRTIVENERQLFANVRYWKRMNLCIVNHAYRKELLVSSLRRSTARLVGP